MKIELKNISIKELSKDYSDDGEGGVKGYGGKLDIRPPFQREFVYGDKERNAVIDTVSKGFPLNVMYWAVRKNSTFEIIDGQQRTISICQFINRTFSYKKKYFQNLQEDEQSKILNYELSVYLCTGTDTEKLEWFKTINIAGKELTDQELRNAVFHGSWVSAAKKWFSKNSCPAYQIGKDYLNGTPNRQDFLETAIKWISSNKINDYMGQNSDKKNADELWKYFQNVINWVEKNFKSKNSKLIKGVDWGFLFNKFKDKNLDPKKIENETKRLLAFDDTITKPKGIYPFILTNDERYLSIRAFTEIMKQRTYAKQGSKCNYCEKKFEISQMEADHKIPWHKDGKSTEDNCQMLCIKCNRKKSGK